MKNNTNPKHISKTKNDFDIDFSKDKMGLIDKLLEKYKPNMDYFTLKMVNNVQSINYLY